MYRYIAVDMVNLDDSMFMTKEISVPVFVYITPKRYKGIIIIIVISIVLISSEILDLDNQRNEDLLSDAVTGELLQAHDLLSVRTEWVGIIGFIPSE